MKETGLNYFRINVDAIQDIHKYLMNKNDIKQYFHFLKKHLLYY